MNIRKSLEPHSTTNLCQIWLVIGWIVCATPILGCAVGNNLPGPASPTAIEQMLMGQAVESSLSAWEATQFPIDTGTALYLQTSGIPQYQAFIKHHVAKWLGEKGYRIVETPSEASYSVTILVETLGVEQAVSFLGMPPVQSVLLPFALPELTLFKAQYQTGYARFRLDVFKTKTGQFVHSTPWQHGDSYYYHFTVLFFIPFHTTSLSDPP
ncbi:MAG: hypothetical protein D6690_14155 [Nitrospirae bacterium]|nr:MAG: hypothetical protein D6690_14155 [Nitrospirota bacterium]